MSEQRVVLHHLVPLSVFERGGEAVFGCDPGLCVVAGEAIAFCRSGQPLQADLNPLLIPECSILLFEKEQPAGVILTGTHPGGVEVHQG